LFDADWRLALAPDITEEKINLQVLRPFGLVVNLKTAKAIGIDLPAALLSRVGEMIE
jgi:hypothetical protein